MKLILLTALCVLSITLKAQQEVKDFSLTNVRDNKAVSLSSFTSSKLVVVIFTSHECPFDNYYKDRIKDLINSYSGTVQFVLINSNTEPEENNQQMAIHYTDLMVPYLSDKDQVVMSMLGAKKTPEVFILSNSKGKFSVSYDGAIDDNPQSASDARQNFLKDAIEKLLNGHSVDSPNQRVTGCTIRRK
jgi:peroxiredoxin